MITRRNVWRRPAWKTSETRAKQAAGCGWCSIVIPSLSAQTETPAAPTPRAPATFAVPSTATPGTTATAAPAAPATFAFPAPPSNAGEATSESTVAADTQPTAQATSSVAVFDVPPGRYEGQIDSATPAVRYRLTLQRANRHAHDGYHSGDLDPFLLLFDESETLLASNDDVETGIAARRSPLPFRRRVSIWLRRRALIRMLATVTRQHIC